MPHNTFATSGPSLVGYTLDNGRLEFLSVLGCGAYGVVYLAVDLHATTPVYLAVKCLLRAGLDSRQRRFQRREIALHKLASRHPNVVTLHKTIEQGDYIFVIMDFCEEGDLFGMITERQRYIGNDALIKKVFLQIVDSVEYCHSMGIFHRDLKPENILCSKDGSKICIADFGLATSERTSSDFGCGSTFYLSPECQGGLFERLECYSTAGNDIWSLGVILVNLTCGRNPWRQACPSDETFQAYVQNPDFLRTILPISHATHNILKGLFALDPKHRMGLAELRRAVLAVESFTMSEDELRTAHSAARAAAAAVRPIPPPASKPSPAQQQRPRPTRAAPLPPSPPASPKLKVDQVEIVDIEIEDQLYQQQPSENRVSVWSGSQSHSPRYHQQITAPSPALTIDEAMLDQIDFTDKQQPHRQHKQRSGESEPYSAYDIEPYPLVPNSSRSSSSGDITLPPTPEFNPADKANPSNATKIPRWNLADSAPIKGKAMVQGEGDSYLLHSLSPSPDIRII